MGSYMGRRNQYIQLVHVLVINKKLLSFSHRVRGLNGQPQRREVSVRHRGLLTGGKINMIMKH